MQIMPTDVNSFLRARVAINCQGGGYEHVYDMSSTTYGQAAIDLKMILKSLSIILEGNSMIANAVISSIGGVADGYEISHGDIGAPQLLIQSGSLGTETTTPGVSADPSRGIRWQLDTGAGFAPTRLLRSIRGIWIVNNQLVQAVSNPSNSNTAIGLGTSPSTYLSYLQIGAAPYSAADALSNYFSIVRDKTALYKRTPGGPAAYRKYDFLAANGTPGSPDWQVRGISRKNIGKGWPRISARNRAFA
jgi:hypothetical protein